MHCENKGQSKLDGLTWQTDNYTLTINFKKKKTVIKILKAYHHCTLKKSAKEAMKKYLITVQALRSTGEKSDDRKETDGIRSYRFKPKH